MRDVCMSYVYSIKCSNSVQLTVAILTITRGNLHAGLFIYTCKYNAVFEMRDVPITHIFIYSQYIRWSVLFTVLLKYTPIYTT